MDCLKTACRTGIVGGTFDPIHYGHLIIGETAREQLDLDRVLYIPSGNPYMKQDVTEAVHRYKMTELAVSDNPYFSVSDIETTRSGPTYTYETLGALKELYPYDKFYFIVGADTLCMISAWRHPEIVLANCTLAVSVRDGYSLVQLNQEIDTLKEKFNADIMMFTLGRYDISSTLIKEKIKNHQSVKYFLPDQVMNYIRQKELYQAN